MNALRRWMLLATRAEQLRLASGAGTGRQYLYQLADGRRNPSAELAAAIELSAASISKESKGRLPKLGRQDLCAACRVCPYSPNCKEPSVPGQDKEGGL
jgi:hypothetical protein